jgi:biopolymer transport protein TolR
MARHTKLTSLTQISDINLTPLMDLTFILLITFIITFPLIEQGIPINLPKGEAEELDPESMRTITVERTGKLYLDDIPINDDELNAEMNDLGEADPDVTVMVRADEELQYKRVMEVMKILHGARITRVALVTQPEGK